MTKKERKLARQGTTKDIVNRFPKGGVDPLTYTAAAKSGGPTGRNSGSLGAAACRRAFDQQKGR